MARERMGRVDHAWLRMDNPRNWMVITGMMTLGSPLDVERLKEVVQTSLLTHRRFRQRLAWSRLPASRPFWEDDPNFNLNTHIKRVTLPEPANQASLQALVSEVMSHGLDYDHPLWRFYIVENYAQGGALIARLHHCLADGIALVRVLLSMTTTSPDYPSLPVELPELTRKDHPLDHNWLEETLGMIPATLRDTAHLAGEVARFGVETLEHPASLLDKLRLGSQLLTATGSLALRWPDNQTIFRGPLGYTKRAAWSQPLRVDQIKQIGRAHGATVNDVLLTAVAGALRSYLVHRNQAVEALSIRGFIPVNLRPLEDAIELGNKFGLVFLSLPLGIADPVRRLRALKRNMDAIKTSKEPIASFGILGLIGSVPSFLQAVALNIFDAKGTAVMTNVPGPKQPLYLSGVPVKTIMAWVPQSGRVSMGISILSYDGNVWLGVATDENLVPDPDRIVAYFESEYAAMSSHAARVMDKRHAPVKPLLAQLDAALSELDGLLAGQHVPDAAAGCQARTRSGNPCKNPALAGEKFCRVHLPK